MPQNKKQGFVFGIMMVFVMVYGMVVYNIALAQGSLELSAFKEALHELTFMVPIAFVLETLVVGRLAKKAAFRMVKPNPQAPYLIVGAISICTVWMMVPLMSFIATLIFQGANADLFTNWITATVKNAPLAFGWQLLVVGPLVRFVFRKLFLKRKGAEEAAVRTAPEGAE